MANSLKEAGRRRVKSIAIKELIDLQRYPIDQLQHPERALTVARVRAALAEDGCAVIRDFFSPVGLAKLLSEATARKAQAYYSGSNTGNVDRMLLIMSFAGQAGMIGSSVRSNKLYGRITQTQLEHDRNRVRSGKLHD